MSLKRVAFRADASIMIGTGHVARCLTLADRLRNDGVDCVFLQRERPGHLGELIRSRGHEVDMLPAPAAGHLAKSETDRDRWLVGSQSADAVDTLSCLDREALDWIVVDHYGLSHEWHRTVSRRTSRLMVIDDLADRPLYCDLLLDQNYSPDRPGRYQQLVPSHTVCLLGPEFVLMAPEYAKARRSVVRPTGELARVLVYYGGADLTGQTERAIRVLERPEFAYLKASIVIGPGTPGADALRLRASLRAGTQVYGLLDSLIDLSLEADLALGAGGTTTWERCALGLPAVVTATASNQVPFSEALGRDGMIHYLGTAADVDDDDLVAALNLYADNAQKLSEMSSRSWALTDGCGAGRVAAAMIGVTR